MRKYIVFLGVLGCLYATFTYGAPRNSAAIYTIALQNDLKIVAAGQSVVNNQKQFSVVRYGTGGILDSTFDVDGIVTTAIGEEAWVDSIVVQSDGKIVAGGESDGVFALARYTTTGALDTAFGEGGKVITVIGEWSHICALGLQSDQKIVAVGVTAMSGQIRFALARYNSDGSLDTTFGDDGIVTTVIGKRSKALAMAIQSDGKIVTGGWSYSVGEIFALARYNTDGSLDSSFGVGGIVTTGVNGYHECIRAIVVQSDGKIIAAGNSRVSRKGTKNYQFIMVRYSSTGDIDTTFGDDGIVLTEVGKDAHIMALGLLSDEKIIAAGYSDNKFALACYMTGGALNTDFDVDGTITSPVGKCSFINALAVQPDDKIVVAGTSENDFVIQRYLTNGQMDPDFGNDGMINEPGGTDVEQGAITFLWDEKETGTNGGTFEANTWQTRNLNKITGKRGTVVLDNNQFTLQPGSYEIYVQAPANKVEIHQIRLYNVTDSAAIKYGSAAYSQGSSGSTTDSILRHYFVLNKAKTFEIQHQCSRTRNRDGLGISAGFTTNKEVYTHVEIIHR